MPTWLGLLGVLVLRAEGLDTVASVAISSHGEARRTLCLLHSRTRIGLVPYCTALKGVLGPATCGFVPEAA